jgi:hypothetical protein
VITLLAARAALSRIPLWVHWTLLALAVACASYGLGRIHEARIGAAALASYKEKAAIQTVRIEKGETVVVTKTEIQYRDRVQKIYVQGEKIEKAIPDYVQPADDARFAVNAGFLRVVDGAWAGEIAGPASDADREPSAIPISEIARTQAANATSCRAWRDKVLGWRNFYAEQQAVINGAAGDWYHPSTTEEK